MPFVFYQIWQFVSVGLTETERRYIVFFVPLSFIFFILGCVFGYWVMLPMMLKFFLSFSSPLMVPMIAVSKYISFVGMTVLSCGFVFEWPLVIVFLTKIGVATPHFLAEKRKYAIVLAFIASAVLTPSPDCFSQIIMAVPLIILYEISILYSKLTYRMGVRKPNVNFDGPPIS